MPHPFRQLRREEALFHRNTASGYNRNQVARRFSEEGINSEYAEDLFFMPFNFGATFAAGATVQQTSQVQADSDFEWIKSTWYGYLNSSGADTQSDSVMPPFTISITDTGSGRILMSAPTPLADVAGTGRLPFINPVKRLFKANASVTVTMTSLSSAQWDDVYFTMIGRKIFKYG